MSQFRIKNIDNAIPDEWLYKINDGISTVGDDIDARDPNELADAILDTQTIILKTSTLPASQILKPNVGLAERITVLEGIAGNSTLQDIYTNGNTISILPTKPLVFGTGEEFKLDENGNLSFKAATLKVKGVGFSTLDLTNVSLTSSLGDLLVGATSPGRKLTLRAEDDLFLKDIYLTNAITLSEFGNSELDTTSQSLVGAINELKNSSFSTTLQSIYGQSSPPKLTTNTTQGAIIFEESSSSSTADTLRITGILNVTKKAKVGDLKVGNNTTLADTTGLVTSDPVKTTNRVETPLITSGTNDLTITDKRVSFPFSDVSVTDLATTKKSVIGAINELKSNITALGVVTGLFGLQHDDSTGNHKIITTQADIGQNTTKRFIVKNASGTETFSINGLGDVIANSATIGGLNTVTLLNSLITHLADDGTSHSAFADHLLDSNPHNVVKTIFGLSGSVSVVSSDNSLNILTSGNSIDFKLNNTVTLQQVYNNLVAKELTLAVAGLSIKDNTSTTILGLQAANITANKDLVFQNTTPKISSTTELTIEPETELILSSTTEDVIIETVDSSKTVVIQGVDFNEAGITSIPSNLGASVLGALKKINDGRELSLDNDAKHNITFRTPFFADSLGRAWPHIPNLHPANEYLSEVDFFWDNQNSLYYPTANINSGVSGTFFSSGTYDIQASSAISLPGTFYKGAKLYPMSLGYGDINVVSATLMADNDEIEINSVVSLVGKTIATPVLANGEFTIEQTGDNKIKTDLTRDNIIATINSQDFNDSVTTPISLKAALAGEASKTTFIITGTVANNETITINSSATDEGVSVVLTAKTSPSGWLEFQASTNPEIVAASLAALINKTTFKETVGGTDGHKCKATVNGAVVSIEYFKPGLTGQLVTLSTSSAGVTAGTMTGGTAVVRIYDMNISNATPYTIAFSGSGSGIVIPLASFIAKEKADDYFITANEALSTMRYSPYYKARELGSIEAVSGNVITFKIKG